MLVQMIYMSYMNGDLKDADFENILAASRRNNTKLGITGLLIVKGDMFMQALEGEEAVIDALYEKIGKDPRHHFVSRLYKRPIHKRDFPNWSMGFKNIDQLSISSDKLINFDKLRVNSKEFVDNPALVHSLFQNFIEGEA